MKNYLGLIEMLLVFGSVLVVVIWEIYSLRDKGVQPAPKKVDAHDPAKDD